MEEQSMPHLTRTGSSFEAGQEECHFTQLPAHLDQGPYYVTVLCGVRVEGEGKVKTML